MIFLVAQESSTGCASFCFVLTPFHSLSAHIPACLRGSKVYERATAPNTCKRAELTCGRTQLLELYHLKQEKQLQLVFLSVVNLAAKTSVVLLCGPGEVSLAQAAFPNGRLFNSSPAGEFDAEDRQSLSQLGIALGTCCMDVGALMSRKKEFKPAVDEVLSAGWTMPEPEAVKPRARLRTIVATMIDEKQKLKRCFSLKEDDAPCAA